MLLKLTFCLLLPFVTTAYEANATITVTTASPLHIWFAFSLWEGNTSPFHYHGPLVTTGQHTLRMNTSTQIAGSSSNGNFWQLYLAAYGNGESNTLTVTQIVATALNISLLKVDSSVYDRHVWEGSPFNWDCDTSVIGCCVVQFGLNNDGTNVNTKRTPCNDLYGFESSREGFLPTVEPTSFPTLIPTMIPSLVNNI